MEFLHHKRQRPPLAGRRGGKRIENFGGCFPVPVGRAHSRQTCGRPQNKGAVTTGKATNDCAFVLLKKRLCAAKGYFCPFFKKSSKGECYHMCGIVGFIGQEQAAPSCWTGSRIWNTAGMTPRAWPSSRRRESCRSKKAVGRLKVLSEQIQRRRGLRGCIGLGHTRWATHGAPNIINSHPHVSENGKVRRHPTTASSKTTSRSRNF